jgi:hypothetical protein
MRVRLEEAATVLSGEEVEATNPSFDSRPVDDLPPDRERILR